MKKQQKQLITGALKTLAIVFAMFFVMAFACGEGGEEDRPRGQDNYPPISEKPDTPATRADVLTEAIIEGIVEEKVKRVQANFDPEVAFESVRICNPIRATRDRQFGEHSKGEII